MSATITWKDASGEKPDADILVLACNRHGTFYLASWTGEPGASCGGWYDPETMRPLPVAYWADLPETPA
jgi:hypothetical protein